MTHVLKCWTEFYDLVENGSKTFEVRRDDRPYAAQDLLVLQDFDPETKEFSGREQIVMVGFALRDEAFVKPGFVILSIMEPDAYNWMDRLHSIAKGEKHGVI